MHKYLTLAIIVLMTGATYAPAVASSQASEQQVFEGVMFGVGPVGALLGNNAPSTRATRDELKHLEAQLRARNPNTLLAFAKSTTSGDPSSVHAAIESITRAIEALSRPKGAAKDPTSVSEFIAVVAGEDVVAYFGSPGHLSTEDAQLRMRDYSRMTAFAQDREDARVALLLKSVKLR